jgi:hypothetical protein
MSDEPKDMDDELRAGTVQFVLDRNNEFTTEMKNHWTRLTNSWTRMKIQLNGNFCS